MGSVRRLNCSVRSVTALAVALLVLSAPGTPSLGSEERPLGREDLIEISVFEVPELNRTVRITEAGTISLPLIGEVQAAGLTPRELEMRLKEMLSRGLVRDPEISVFVQEHGSKRVSVLGAVGKPGVYAMLGPRTLLQILAEAGGVLEEAGQELYVIRHQPDGTVKRIPISLQGLMTQEGVQADLLLEPGDVISVPRDRLVYVYVDGAVKSPGRIEQPTSRALTVLQAIAKAGGSTERANLKKVRILRREPGGTQRAIPVDVRSIRDGKVPDPILLDGDVVVVPETFF